MCVCEAKRERERKIEKEVGERGQRRRGIERERESSSLMMTIGLEMHYICP